MNVAFLCLGGNMGDRLAFINKAKGLISNNCGKITAQSYVYETRAWGMSGEPDYYNQCIQLETELEPSVLLQRLLYIEKQLGRVRTGDKNQSRFIDIDIILYDDLVISEEHCHIPHPRMHLRHFVLNPLNDIAPDVRHPVLKKTVSQLLKECDDQSSIKKLTDVHLY